jgi:hypothetical protein
VPAGRYLALALCFAIGCASAQPVRQVRVSILGSKVVPNGTRESDHFVFIEYRDPSGALVHDEILVTPGDFVRFRERVDVCMSRGTDGYRLAECQD